MRFVESFVVLVLILVGAISLFGGVFINMGSFVVNGLLFSLGVALLSTMFLFYTGLPEWLNPELKTLRLEYEKDEKEKKFSQSSPT